MDLRLALYELAARHRLDAPALLRLEQLAGLHEPPVGLTPWLPRGVAVLAAALGGFGLILWIAANWDALGRLGQFTLLQGAVVLASLVAWRSGVARLPAGLLALLGVGGLLAYFGQTYQTGADPWQLFALWAALVLPLCLALRSDLLWAPWALVVMTAVTLWQHAHLGHRWQFNPADLPVHLLGWAAAILLVLLLGPLLRERLGSGAWAWRTAITLLVSLVSAAALGGLFLADVAPHYGLGLGLLGLVAGLLSLPRGFDVFGLSAVALGIDTLLVAGLARWLWRDLRGDWVGPLLLLGLVAAGVLALTVSALLRLARRRSVVPARTPAAGEAR